MPINPLFLVFMNGLKPVNKRLSIFSNSSFSKKLADSNWNILTPLLFWNISAFFPGHTATHLLHQTGLTDFLITSALDKTYGETIVLLTISRSTAKIKSAIATLPKYWRPKHIIEIQEIPLTETGKPNRAEAKIIANELIKSPLWHFSIKLILLAVPMR